MSSCPVDAALVALSGRWKPLILWYLRGQSLRFGELRRNIPEISERMLAKSLRELEADAFIDRQAFAEVPPRVEYSLTPRGRSVVPIIDDLVSWAFREAMNVPGNKSD